MQQSRLTSQQNIRTHAGAQGYRSDGPGRGNAGSGGCLGVRQIHLDPPDRRAGNHGQHQPVHRYAPGGGHSFQRRLYHREKKWTDDEADAIVRDLVDRQQRYATCNRRLVVALARERQLVLAGHDDTTIEDCIGAAEDGVTIRLSTRCPPGLAAGPPGLLKNRLQRTDGAQSPAHFLLALFGQRCLWLQRIADRIALQLQTSLDAGGQIVAGKGLVQAP